MHAEYKGSCNSVSSSSSSSSSSCCCCCPLTDGADDSEADGADETERVRNRTETTPARARATQACTRAGDTSLPKCGESRVIRNAGKFTSLHQSTREQH
eukprot:6174536-Pleurochrysis_carterae.AAC.2